MGRVVQPVGGGAIVERQHRDRAMRQPSTRHRASRDRVDAAPQRTRRTVFSDDRSSTPCRTASDAAPQACRRCTGGRARSGRPACAAPRSARVRDRPPHLLGTHGDRSAQLELVPGGGTGASWLRDPRALAGAADVQPARPAGTSQRIAMTSGAVQTSSASTTGIRRTRSMRACGSSRVVRIAGPLPARWSCGGPWRARIGGYRRKRWGRRMARADHRRRAFMQATVGKRSEGLITNRWQVGPPIQGGSLDPRCDTPYSRLCTTRAAPTRGGHTHTHSALVVLRHPSQVRPPPHA
jgi:hypothetical protein